MAHIIVVGNEKGGSGKSTTCMHVATALARMGHRVGALDLDLRQRSFGRYVENRLGYMAREGLNLPTPDYGELPEADSATLAPGENPYDNRLSTAVAELEPICDFIVIDCPGSHTRLSQVAHSLADTLITPLNDSLIDLDVMAHIDPVTGEARELSHYARLVQRARTERMSIDGQSIDWILVRNRISMLSSRNMRMVQSSIDQIALRLGCRVAEGIAERVIFRSLFATGLTVFDPLDDDMIGGLPSMSHISARQEYRQLVDALNLPVSEKAQARRAGMAQWAEANGAAFEHMA